MLVQRSRVIIGCDRSDWAVSPHVVLVVHLGLSVLRFDFSLSSGHSPGMRDE